MGKRIFKLSAMSHGGSCLTVAMSHHLLNLAGTHHTGLFVF